MKSTHYLLQSKQFVGKQQDIVTKISESLGKVFRYAWIPKRTKVRKVEGQEHKLLNFCVDQRRQVDSQTFDN